MKSPLQGQSRLNPKGGSIKRAIMASLLLTSLVDAFSILVLYLLSSYSTSGEFMAISKNMILPAAANSVQLERTTIVRVDNGQFYVEDKATTADELTARLLEIRNLFNSKKDENFQPSLIVQADKKVTYDLVTQIVHAGAQAGYSEIKFAVLAER